MAVAFGFSVGDLLALTKVTSKVVSELKESGEAPAKYQNLIVDLELLKTALSRLYDVEPGQHGLKHLESIRAAATACQRTLEAFLDRISKFDKTLGSWDAKEKRFRGIGRRIQFSVAFEKEVKELRTTLAGHVSTIMVLLATQIMESIDTAERRQTAANHTILHQGKIIAENISENTDLLRDIACLQDATGVKFDALKELLQRKDRGSSALGDDHLSGNDEQWSILESSEIKLAESNDKIDDDSHDKASAHHEASAPSEMWILALAFVSKTLISVMSGLQPNMINIPTARAATRSQRSSTILDWAPSSRKFSSELLDRVASHKRWTPRLQPSYSKCFEKQQILKNFHHSSPLGQDAAPKPHKEHPTPEDSSKERVVSTTSSVASKFTKGEKVWLKNLSGTFEEEVCVDRTRYDGSNQKWMYHIKDSDGTPFHGNFTKDQLARL